MKLPHKLVPNEYLASCAHLHDVFMIELASVCSGQLSKVQETHSTPQHESATQPNVTAEQDADLF